MTMATPAATFDETEVLSDDAIMAATQAILRRQGSQRRGRIAPTHMYYRRRDGSVGVGVASRIERAAHMEEGWTPLTQYGRFDMAHPWAAKNPYTTLFQVGGAKELPVWQIYEMGYDLAPPLVPTCGEVLTELHNHDTSCMQGARPVVFPQLADVPPREWITCRFCSRKFYAEEGRDVHEGVMHKDERGDIKTGQVLAEGVVKGQNMGNDRLVEALTLAIRTAQAPAINGQEVLDVLQGVGLNLRQIKALQDAGLVAKEPAEDGD